MTIRGLRALLIAVTLLTSGGAAMADEKDKDLAGAREAFKAGQRLMMAGRYQEALAKLKRAHELSQDPLVMGYVALAHEKLGNYAEALKALQTYREGVGEQERGDIDRLIGKYQQAEGLSDAQVRASAPATADTGLGSKPAEEGRSKYFWTWVAGGTAAGLALTGLVLGVSAASSFESLDGSCSPSCPGAAADSVAARAIATDVVLGAAAAAGAAAVFFYFMERAEKPVKKPKAAALELIPALGGGRVGLGARLRF